MRLEIFINLGLEPKEIITFFMNYFLYMLSKVRFFYFLWVYQKVDVYSLFFCYGHRESIKQRNSSLGVWIAVISHFHGPSGQFFLRFLSDMFFLEIMPILPLLDVPEQGSLRRNEWLKLLRFSDGLVLTNFNKIFLRPFFN